MTTYAATIRRAHASPTTLEPAGPVQTPAVLVDRRPVHRVAGLGTVPTIQRVYQRQGAETAPIQPGSEGVVQCLAVQITHPGADNINGNIIPDVVITGRPKRLYPNSMGDHTTAFTVFSLGLETRLAELTMGQALQLMKDLTSELKELPGWIMRNSLPEDHRTRLTDCHTVLLGLADRVIDEDAQLTVENIDRLQRIVEAYLEVRELIPLSAINTKSIDPALAGKGKGENATPLAEYQTYRENLDNDIDPALAGNNVPDEMLMQAVLSTFDPYAVAAVASTKTQEDMTKIAPGMKIQTPFGLRIQVFIKQHVESINSFYPYVYEQLKMGDDNSKIQLSMMDQVLAATLKHDTERKFDLGAKPTRPRNISTGIRMTGDLISGVNIAGRPPSPYSGTMGAHTTAWIVYKDQIGSKLLGKTLAQGAVALLALIDTVLVHMNDSLSHFPTDSKQLSRLTAAMQGLDVVHTPLKNIKNGNEHGTQEWETEALLLLQESVGAILTVENCIPGATLDVADINGKREGAHREVLNNPGGEEPQKLQIAIVGMLDIKNLRGFMETSRQNVNDDPGVAEEEAGFKAFTGMDRPVIDKTVDQAELFIVRHHLKTIQDTYPEAFLRSGFNLDADDEALKILVKASLDLRSNDEAAYADVEDEEA